MVKDMLNDSILDKQFYSFNYSSNRDKLFGNLIGIIDGIVCDGELTEEEILYLDTWILDSEMLSNNYYVKAIRHHISNILADGKITDEEKQFLAKTLQKIRGDFLKSADPAMFSKESDVHLLSGLCKGVVCDGKLRDEEILFLNKFIRRNAQLRNNYPGSEVYDLITTILADGVITQKERDFLKQVLCEFGGVDLEQGIVDGLSLGSYFFDLVDEVNLEDKTVCFTGKFLYGPRSACRTLAIEQGARITNEITTKLDFLIVGALNSRDWKFQSFGRKIEKAKYFQRSGYDVKIITEQDWLLDYL